MNLTINLTETKERHRLLYTDELQAVVKIEAALLKGARKYFDSEGFTEIVVPHITKATGSCENIETLFELDFFGEKGYLVQTGQLYLEAFIPKFEKVCCMGPSFRAEEEVDERHLCEFPLLEIELQCDLDQLMIHIENTILSMLKEVTNTCEKELEFLGIKKENLEEVEAPFEKMTYREAIKILGLEFGADLKSRHERKLVEMFGNKPLFITHYPEKIKFFNMRTNDEDKEIVNSTDLLLPFSGEAVGAAEREYEYERLLEKLKKSTMLKQLERRGGGIEDFTWYLENIKESGSVPHAGCGIGLNRVTQFVLGFSDIRACTAFPLNRKSLM